MSIQEREESQEGWKTDNAKADKNEMVRTHVEVEVLVLVEKLDRSSSCCYTGTLSIFSI